MKLTYLSLFIFTVFTLQLSSQEYDPIIKEGSFWDIETEFWATGSKEYQRIQVDGEIEINNTIYTKLKKAIIQVSDDAGEPQFIIDNSKFIQITDLYLRENIDEKKLYIFDNDKNKEFVLCDFNLNIGDSIENYYGYQAEDISVEITDITINNDNKKVFHTDQGVKYTEGIGKSDNNLTSYINTVDGFFETVVCNGNAQNQNDCATVLSTEENELLSIKIFPNPVNDILSIKNVENITIKIYSVNGSLLKNIKSKTNLDVDISSFKSGVYILEISSLKGKKLQKILKL
ncbi:MAG: T9SS type A sorting domain-containing protein [Polaribacter sp.]|uniref:T9SS type A sorting domain-containing protein n=1 Tax=Polaribacter sp. TaxID=1920175 RepID=UPI003BB08811